MDGDDWDMDGDDCEMDGDDCDMDGDDWDMDGDDWDKDGDNWDGDCDQDGDCDNWDGEDDNWDGEGEEIDPVEDLNEFFTGLLSFTEEGTGSNDLVVEFDSDCVGPNTIELFTQFTDQAGALADLVGNQDPTDLFDMTLRDLGDSLEEVSMSLAMTIQSVLQTQCNAVATLESGVTLTS